jgi:hypothetical protein
MLTELD